MREKGPRYCGEGEHKAVGTAFGKLMCFTCNTEVVLVRGHWANWYVEDKDVFLAREKEERERAS